MDYAVSKNNVKIRLPAERWLHITEGHSELAGYFYEIIDAIENPDEIYSGNAEELLAVKKINSKFLIVIYKEISDSDGFIITAFISKRIEYLTNKKLLWKKQN